jgi:hypothetical protein
LKKYLPLIVIAFLVLGYLQNQGGSSPGSLPEPGRELVDHSLRDAFEGQLSDVQVHGKGTVLKVLPDDLEGSRHQRIILKLSHGATLLIAHNIDLAPRIPGIEVGDLVEFFGEYEWNSKGGVLHWTHHDPAGRHAGGWLKHEGHIYQ